MPVCVTYQVQDEERGKRGIGLDGVGRHRAGGINCHAVRLKTDEGILRCPHHQFHHQTRETPGNLKNTPRYRWLLANVGNASY